MLPRDPGYLIDMREASELIQAFIQGKDKAAFLKDLMLQSAVMRQLEILGEAAKRVSEDLKSIPELLSRLKLIIPQQ